MFFKSRLKFSGQILFIFKNIILEDISTFCVATGLMVMSPLGFKAKKREENANNANFRSLEKPLLPINASLTTQMHLFQIALCFLLLTCGTRAAAQDIFEVAQNLGCDQFIDWVNRSSFIRDTIEDIPGKTPSHFAITSL